MQWHHPVPRTLQLRPSVRVSTQEAVEALKQGKIITCTHCECGDDISDVGHAFKWGGIYLWRLGKSRRWRKVGVEEHLISFASDWDTPTHLWRVDNPSPPQV